MGGEAGAFFGASGGIPGAGGGGAGEAAEEAGELAGSAERGVLCGEQGVDRSGVFLGEVGGGRLGDEAGCRIHGGGCRIHFGCGVSLEAVGTVATAPDHLLAEVTQEMLVEAAVLFRVAHDLLESIEVLLFAAEEEFLHPFGEGGEVLWFLEPAVGVADPAEFEDEVAMGLQVGEGLDDAFALAVELLGGGIGIDGGPEAGFLAGGEEVAKKFLAV